jgi:hypothetical protein
MFLFAFLSSLPAQFRPVEPRSPFPQPAPAPAGSFRPFPLPVIIPPYLPPESLPPALGRIRNPEVAARYFVDVTTFGAKSDPYFDNTAAIQAAINTVCMATPNSTIKAVLYFPPGLYVIHQPQLPSTNSPLNIPCTFEMEGDFTNGGAQFPEMSEGSWIQTDGGLNPNAAAAMTFTSSPTNLVLPIMKNLTIVGVNQAVAVYAAAPARFEDVCLTVPATGMVDNTPLKITDTFWLWFVGGCLQSVVGVPTAILTAETVSVNAQAEGLDGLIYMSDIIAAGDGFKYIQRVPNHAGLAGNMVFRNITLEDANDIFAISETCTGCEGWIITSLTFDHVGTSDSDCFSCSVVNMNAPSGVVSGITINHGFAGNAGMGRAITINAGRLADYWNIAGCLACVEAVVDGNGDPLWSYHGKVTLEGGTKTVQFFPIAFFHAPPVCVSDDENPASVSHITTTMTSMTIVANGQSDVVNYACFPNDPYPQT